MAGAFVFAAGLIVSGFAPNVIFLYFSYGLMQGELFVRSNTMICVGRTISPAAIRLTVRS